MKYLPVPDFEAVTGALNFNTPDCHVTGGCDLYTTKSTGSDKKLYKNIDKDLSSQHEALVKLGASLSPPEREHMLATSPSMQLFSTSSAFGPLSELSSRRTFAYMIATLNASHPHYDFSHVLRPGDFKRERNLRRVMGNLDSILQNVRPASALEPASLGSASLGSDSASVWGPQCWARINKEMRLNECTVFRYSPETDPFEEDESAIWAAHYFFFSRALKRVAYLYVRVVPVVSSHSPSLRPMRVSGGGICGGAGCSGGVGGVDGLQKGYYGGSSSSSSGGGGGGVLLHGPADDDAVVGSGGSCSTRGSGIEGAITTTTRRRSRRRRMMMMMRRTAAATAATAVDTENKRATYWLSDGDDKTHLVIEAAAADEDDEPGDDGFYWNRGEDGDIVAFSDDDYVVEEVEEEEGEEEDTERGRERERLMSEDVAGKMEI